MPFVDEYVLNAGAETRILVHAINYVNTPTSSNSYAMEFGPPLKY